MKLYLLAIKLLLRQWRSGELYILLAALTIAVAALSSISFYTDRINRALDLQASEVLGGDMVMTSPFPISNQYQAKAQQFNLQTAEIILFPTVAVAGSQLQLIAVKAVPANYPLRGHLMIADKLNDKSKISIKIPDPGSVWVDAKLLPLLNVNVGSTVIIGELLLKIEHILTYEPDTDSNVFNIAPRVLMNINDVGKTQIIQPGSRVTYRLLLTGSVANLNKYRKWLMPQLTPQQKLLSIKEGNLQIVSILKNAENYLHLAVIICVILAGIAIAVTARHFAHRHFDQVALLRCIGLTQKQILYLIGFQIFLLGFIGTLLGCIFGYFSQLLLEKIFAGWFNVQLPGVSITASLMAVLTGILLLFSFALAPLLQLTTISPIRVLARELPVSPPSFTVTYGGAIAIIAAILLWHSPNVQLTLLLLYGFAFSALILYWVGYGLIQSSQIFPSVIRVNWRYGLTNLARRSASSTVQLVAFGLVIMVALLLTFIRSDLLTSWQNQLPKNAPDYFAINIQPDQVNAFIQLLKQQNIVTSGIYPMVRGRLITLNGKPIKQAVPKGQSNNEALNRELNLTWTSELPSDNHVVVGKWFNANDYEKSVISVELNLARELDFNIGDQLGFQIGDQKIQAKIISARTLRWESFHPNFYIIFPPGVLNKLPATYITSFYVPAPQKNILSSIVKQFPSVTLIDVTAVLAQARQIISNISWAIEFILVFTLLAGLAILYATLYANLDERLYEGALLRTLGASSQQLYRMLATEFICLGILAGLFAAVCASIIAYLLAKQVLGLEYYSIKFIYWIYSAIAGGAIIGVAGLIGTRSVVKQSPLIVLRGGD